MKNKRKVLLGSRTALLGFLYLFLLVGLLAQVQTTAQAQGRNAESSLYEDIDMKEWNVSRICTRKVISVHASSPVSEVLIQMAELRINRFPVVSDSDSDILIGWITRTDIMRLYRQQKRFARSAEAEAKLFHEIDNNPDLIKKRS